jgi:hypothetical protein
LKKIWNILSWILIFGTQVGAGYAIVSLSKQLISTDFKTITQFLIIPIMIWLGYSLGIYGIGMIGLVLKRVKPLFPILRLATTMLMAAAPMVMLTFNAFTLGLANPQEFDALVMARMVPYYTQLCVVFAMLGFFITVWWQKNTRLQMKPQS